MTVSSSDSNWWTSPFLVFAPMGLLCLIVPEVRDFFLDTGQRWAYIFLLAFLVTFTLTPLVRRLGIKFGVMDIPTERRIHQIPTPRVGGAGVFIGFALAVLGNWIIPEKVAVILLGGLLLMLVGIFDDACGLPAWFKLVVQLTASGLVVWWGMVLSLFPTGLLGDMGNIALTVFWLIGITNAFNFMDGMDGLAGGLAVIIAFFLGVVAFQTNQPELGWLSIGIIGAVLGFLPFNFRRSGPALVFLGDGGSTFLGFTLAALAVMGEWADGNAIVSFSNPILIFWVLIYDMVHLTVDRMVTGKIHSFKDWIDYVGKDHIHHRLARVLGGNRSSVLMIYCLTICLGLGAIGLRSAETADALILLMQAILIVTMLTVFEFRSRGNSTSNSVVTHPGQSTLITNTEALPSQPTLVSSEERGWKQEPSMALETGK